MQDMPNKNSKVQGNTPCKIDSNQDTSIESSKIFVTNGVERSSVNLKSKVESVDIEVGTCENSELIQKSRVCIPTCNYFSILFICYNPFED